MLHLGKPLIDLCFCVFGSCICMFIDALLQLLGVSIDFCKMWSFLSIDLCILTDIFLYGF